MVTKPVWVLIIQHKHGTACRVYGAEPLALDSVDQWCRAWWHEVSDKAYPTEGGVEEYFERQSGRESYDLYGPTLIEEEAS